VFLESIRRREISVVFLFMGLFLLGALAARITGVESEAAAQFILNLGLSLAWIFSLLVSIILAARQFPDELENRSLYPLLAKPVPRYTYILGKWLATWLAGAVVSILLSVIALTTAPWPKDMSVVLLLETLLLMVLAMGMATAVAIALSLKLPKALVIVITGLLAFAGGPLIQLLLNVLGPGLRPVAAWVMAYVPNFSRLDLINPLTAGMPALGAVDLIFRMGMAGAVTLFALAVAMVVFERKPL
jgi:ABC-type transport system involved in multi-copper enzyme maturation permease subunit